MEIMGRVLIQFFIVVFPIIVYQLYFYDRSLLRSKWKAEYILLVLLFIPLCILGNLPLFNFGHVLLSLYPLLILYAFLYGNRKMGLTLVAFMTIVSLYIDFSSIFYIIFSFLASYILPFFLSGKWNGFPQKCKYIVGAIIPAVVVLAYWLGGWNLENTPVDWHEKWILTLLVVSFILSFLIIIYVTEYIQKTIKMKYAIQEAEKFSLISEMSAGVAHEVRNPLTVVKGFIQLIDKDSNEKNREYIKLVLSELNRAEGIITDFLQFAGREHTDFHEIEMEGLLKNVHCIMSTFTNMKGIHFSLETVEGLYIEGNASKLKQVYYNMIKNAAEAIHHNNGELQMNCYESNKFVYVEIIDNGIGMDEVELKRIGEPFYTNKTSGSGLGVMVSKTIVADHGGSIIYDSKKGEGSKVSIKLPLYGTII